MRTLVTRNRDAVNLTGAAAAVLIAVLLMPKGLALGAVLINGVIAGLLYGLIAAGLVLVYRSARIINFAALSMGSIGSITFIMLHTHRDVPFFLAMAVGLILGPIVGVLTDLLIMQRFARAQRLVATVATIGVVLVYGWAIGQIISFLQRDELEGRVNIPIDIPFHSCGPGQSGTCAQLDINGFVFDVRHLLAVVLAVVALSALGIFLRRSRLGTAVRASAEDADRASLLGVPVMVVSLTVWGIVGTLSTVATVSGDFIAVFDAASPTESLIPPLAAAILARMASIPVAVAASVLVGVLDRGLSWSYGDNPYAQVALFGVVIVGLLLQRRLLNAQATESSGGWRGARETRPIPAELTAITGVRRARQALIVLAGVGLLGLPYALDVGQINRSSLTAIFAIIAISLVILMGWAGQISLGHMGIVGVSAYIAGIAATTWNQSFWVALPIGALTGAVVAALIGIPALRVRGLFLAITTFVFAACVPSVLFHERFFGRFSPETVDRPKLLFFDFQRSERAYYYLMLIFLALTIIAAQGLRKSRTGRVLIALRDNESGTQAFGVDASRARITAFVISGFIAGIGGVLYVFHQFGVADQSFRVESSINMFVSVIIGGAGSIAGALLGAIYFNVILGYLLPRNLVAIVQALTILGVIILFPGGLTQLVYGARDAVLRIVALRNRVLVPSLFADMSAEEWAKRRAPLAPSSRAGLTVLHPEQRFRLPSRLWGRSTA